ncbi:hypothetical protein DEA8626_02799 [Defluviimonas aquaemixtae]|uniref:Uncharacterized protein n=1 Tax=Albidovulum aquaemixtae TaxID=1542388 RepID=A0A2R8BKA7_9RHOB|nr:hypothetical protein [Defluviimonas aquaemixtae]SPH23730.1 hypothetical protein DEA8626_02799 [Defluviimonas aquaemixtae]
MERGANPLTHGIARAAAAAALDGPKNGVRRLNAAFETRRNLVVEHIARIEMPSHDPSYDTAFTSYVLKAAGIARVSGSTDEMSPFFRMSAAASEDVLARAMERLAAAVATLTNPASQEV